jgi:hypothetical protein
MIVAGNTRCSPVKPSIESFAAGCLHLCEFTVSQDRASLHPGHAGIVIDSKDPRAARAVERRHSPARGSPLRARAASSSLVSSPGQMPTPAPRPYDQRGVFLFDAAAAGIRRIATL